MKKTKDYTIHAILFPLLLACLFNLPGCYKGKTQDKGTDTPKFVNYDFEGERLAARIKQAYKTATITENGETFIDQSILNDEIDLALSPVKSYYIEIESNDTFSLYKGEKFIGKCFLTDDSEIGSLIIHGKN